VLKLSPTAGGDPTAEIAVDGSVTSISFHPGGTLLAAADLTTVRVHDTSGGPAWQIVDPAQESFQLVAFSPDGALLAATTDRTLTLADAHTGAVARAVTLDHRIRAIAWDRHGARLAIGIDDRESGTHIPGGSARVLDAATGTEISRLTHKDAVLSVAFRSDGTSVLSGSADGTARLLDMRSGLEAWHTDLEATVASVAFTADGRFAVCGSAGWSTHVLLVLTGVEEYRITHEGAVTAVATSGNGRWVASAAVDETVQVFDTGTRAEHYHFGPAGEITAMAFSPDSSRLALGIAQTVLILANDVESE
jgi:WD40 repeat protein